MAVEGQGGRRWRATDYNMGWWDKLSHKGDADADGYTNAEEWAAVAADTSLTTAAERREAYTAAALAPGLHGGGAYAPASGAMSTPAGGAGCPETFEIAYGEASFSKEEIPGLFWPELPSGVIVGSAVPVGTVQIAEPVKLTAPEYYGCFSFEGWQSSTLRVNNSRQLKYSFLPEGSGTVRPVYTCIAGAVNSPYAVLNSNVFIEQEVREDMILFAGPPGKVLTVTATHPSARGWRAENSYSYTDTVTTKVVLKGDHMSLQPRTTGYVPGPDAVTVFGTETEGGYVLASFSSGFPGEGFFLGRVRGQSQGYYNLTLHAKAGYRAHGWLTSEGYQSQNTRSVFYDEDDFWLQLYATPLIIKESPRYKVEWEVICVEQEAPFQGEPGHVEVRPLTATFAKGTQVTLTAKMQPGHMFAGWEGNAMAYNSQEQLVPIDQITAAAGVRMVVEGDTKVIARSRFGFPAKDVVGDPRWIYASYVMGEEGPVGWGCPGATGRISLNGDNGTKLEDDCGNYLTINCINGYAEFHYNDWWLVAKCWFLCGRNRFEFRFTEDTRLLHSLRHLNHDRPYSGSQCDSNANGLFDITIRKTWLLEGWSSCGYYQQELINDDLRFDDVLPSSYVGGCLPNYPPGGQS